MSKTITFKFFPRQLEAWNVLNDNVKNEIGFGGGVSGGKSYVGCAWIFTKCMEFPRTRWAIGRNELKNLKRTTLATMFEIFYQNDILVGRDYTYNQMDNIIKFKNGSEILLLDLKFAPSDPLFTWLGSLELTGAFVDESAEIREKALEILRTRVGRCKNKEYKIIPKVLETFNPDKGHVYRNYWKPFKDGKMPKYRAFIRSLVTDNPHNTQDYIDQLMRSSMQTIERLVKGNFDYDDDPTAMFDQDAILDMFTNKVEDKEKKYISCDVARFGIDKTIIIIWWGLQIKKVFVIDKSKTTEVVAKLDELCGEKNVRRSQVIVDEDGVGGGVVDQFDGCKGFLNNGKAIPTQKEVQEKKPSNYQNLKTQCAFKFAEAVNLGKVGIDKGAMSTELAEMLIQELEIMKEIDADKEGKRKMTTKDEMKELLGRSPDIFDGCLMRFYFEVKPKLIFRAVTL